MSLLKQALLTIVLVVAVGAGWYVYSNPALIGLASEAAGEADASGAAGPGARGGGRPGQGGNRIAGLIGRGGAVNVITQDVAVDAGGESVIALGTAMAARSVTVYPQVTGIVTEVPFRQGEGVKEGQPLLMLEDDEQRVAAEKARVALRQAQATLERSRTLAKSKTISTATLLEAETAEQLAQIEVQSKELDLKRRTIDAPFDGITGLTDLSVGDLVTTSTMVTRLDDLSTIRIGFEVPERWAGLIKMGDPITATAQGLPGSKFSGTISAIDNRIDETTRTLRLEAELANEGRALRAGMAITVTLHFDTQQELAIPSLAVQWDRNGSFVWRVVDKAARRADVTIVRRESGLVIVRGDVKAGDKVVVEGVQRLREGALVNEVNETPAMAGERDGGKSNMVGDDVPEMSGTARPSETRS